MALLNQSDLFIINRAADSKTYKVTTDEVAGYVVNILQGGTGGGPGLILNSLNDVTAADATGVHAQGTFIMNNTNAPGNMVVTNFADEVDLVIEAYLLANPPAATLGSVFDLPDVTGTALGTTPETYDDDDYTNTILLGQQNALGSGTNEFKPTEFNALVNNIINGGDPSNPSDPYVKLATTDLTDVFSGNSYAKDEVLIWSVTGSDTDFRAKSIVNIVTNILNGKDPDGNVDNSINIDINPSFLPVGQYDDQTDPLGVVAVAKHAGTDADPQVLTVVNGVLDVNIPEIPDAFKYEGNVYFNEAGSPFKEEGGTTPFPSGATVPPVERGMIYVALVTDGSGNDPTDPSTKRPLIGWKSYNGTGDVAVENGSLVVCTASAIDTGAAAEFAEMGVIDYTPVEQGLQEVLTTDNSSTGIDIELSNSGVTITKGSVTTTEGDFTTAKGNVSTTEGNVSTAQGDIVIGTKGTQDPTEGSLSVPDIDFARFALLSSVT